MIDNVLDLSGKTSVGELVTSIANMDILITIDSAAMHIAAAVKTAFIALLDCLPVQRPRFSRGAKRCILED